MLLGSQMQQAHFQYVVNSRAELGQIERFADEVLGAGFERAQLVRRLGGDDQDGKIPVGLDFLETFHHLKSVHGGHLKIEQNEVVVIPPVEFAYVTGMGG